jgi:hypothetical protein
MAILDLHFESVGIPAIILGTLVIVLIGVAVCTRDWVKTQLQWRSFRFSLEARRDERFTKRDSVMATGLTKEDIETLDELGIPKTSHGKRT